MRKLCSTVDVKPASVEAQSLNPVTDTQKPAITGVGKEEERSETRRLSQSRLSPVNSEEGLEKKARSPPTSDETAARKASPGDDRIAVEADAEQPIPVTLSRRFHRALSLLFQPMSKSVKFVLRAARRIIHHVD